MGTIPKFAIKVFKNINFNSVSGNRSSILLKHAKVHGEKTLRIGLQSKDLIFPKYANMGEIQMKTNFEKR